MIIYISLRSTNKVEAFFLLSHHVFSPVVSWLMVFSDVLQFLRLWGVWWTLCPAGGEGRGSGPDQKESSRAAPRWGLDQSSHPLREGKPEHTNVSSASPSKHNKLKLHIVTLAEERPGEEPTEELSVHWRKEQKGQSRQVLTAGNDLQMFAYTETFTRTLTGRQIPAMRTWVDRGQNGLMWTEENCDPEMLNLTLREWSSLTPL